MNKAFTLTLTLIVMSVALSIGLGVYTIILKEMQLAGLGRESELAFYAADSGAECALYWDVNQGPLSTTTSTTIKCLAQSPSVAFGNPDRKASFKINFDNGACARVVIDKNNPSQTIINSYGYNVDCDSNVSRKVERGVRVTY